MVITRSYSDGLRNVDGAAYVTHDGIFRVYRTDSGWHVTHTDATPLLMRALTHAVEAKGPHSTRKSLIAALDALFHT